MFLDGLVVADNVTILDDGRVILDGLDDPGLFDSLPSWSSSAIGIGDVDSVAQGSSEFVDRFIDEYLRVNASACNG